MPARESAVKGPGHRVTLKFLAEHLGLSSAKVFIVLTNSPIASTIAPPAGFMSLRLTTIHQSLRMMGAMAASTLLQRIYGEEVAEEALVRPQLVIRESTAPAGARK